MSAKKSQNRETFTKTHYHQCVRRVFDFLVSEYGFDEGEADQAGRESLFTYKKCPVAVSIVREGVCIPIVKLKWITHAGSHYAYLHHLTKRFASPRIPNLSKPLADMSLDEYMEIIVNRLQIQADFLKANGKRFLRGDYSSLAENLVEVRKRWKEKKK